MQSVKFFVLVACFAFARCLPLEDNQEKAELSADFHHFPGDGHNHNSEVIMRAKHHPLDGHEHHGLNDADYQVELGQEKTQDFLVDSNKGT
ncbi:unnamed protein product [Allacma fusca]|uniref:Uncharacterized protein n=1 Tax=Allacma fusca TaxID=39272 RepID=A0A8J2K1F5_9HEXA|nr:unnamed protein product [Allacma fusca]